MTRTQRRAVAKAGLVLDIFSLLALFVAVLIGIIPAGRMTAPAVIVAIGIAGGSLYLFLTRSRP
jgi:hypothetical protein